MVADPEPDQRSLLSVMKMSTTVTEPISTSMKPEMELMLRNKETLEETVPKHKVNLIQNKLLINNAKIVERQ